MNIKLELTYDILAELIMHQLSLIDFEPDEIADTKAISALSEIQEVIQDDELSDFDAIEKIVCIFEKYHISAGERHDFG